MRVADLKITTHNKIRCEAVILKVTLLGLSIGLFLLPGQCGLNLLRTVLHFSHELVARGAIWFLVGITCKPTEMITASD